MLGLVLLYVGIVLINNGICRITNIDAKTASVMNVFVGALSVTVNAIVIVHGDFNNNHDDIYTAATGLLFGFTYLFVACNNLFNLDTRAFGWYSLFVAINSIPAAYLTYGNGDFESLMFVVIWLAWGVLWLTGFIECVLKIELKFVPYLAVLEGIFTAWIPAWLLLANVWK